MNSLGTKNPFQGSFDGQGYTISILVINPSSRYVELFWVGVDPDILVYVSHCYWTSDKGYDKAYNSRKSGNVNVDNKTKQIEPNTEIVESLDSYMEQVAAQHKQQVCYM